MTPEAQARKDRAGAGGARQHAPKLALADYERQNALLFSELQLKLAAQLIEHKRQKEAFWAEYERCRAPLWAEYERAARSTGPQLPKVKDEP